MTAGAPVVEVRQLVKRFGGYAAVDGVTLSVGGGEIVGLLGPNGAGKTTLIHMLLGLILPSSGSISIFGLPMPRRRQPILARANFSSAYVQLPLSLTPRQNLTVFGRLYGVKGLAARIDELLERFEIGEMADRPTRALSAGQVSRLNLAKSLLNDPELLLLDEPTASMDPDIADKTRQTIKAIQRERGLAVLYTSHNMREVERLADRVLFLHRGKLVASGSPRDLLARYEREDLEQVFLRIARGG
ncbi:MAG: ABC transporter ATP-binding protein [Elusimicrobia bacterium]|nr:ABC transporter ATP-binding protein [Elusimicrobiota bacterium]MDE2425415.1 ABC transporter ATP-binding protein [Elusimicrobiota bacterium]